MREVQFGVPSFRAFRDRAICPRIMNVDEKNRLISTASLDREDLSPKTTEYEARRFQFPGEFGLSELPTQPGVITIRGPRQSGKSTMYWASSEHQIDFVTGSGDLVEVKAGPFSPKDFAWFRKSFPGAYPSVAIYNPWLCSEREHWD